jgi:hypothetical protein
MRASYALESYGAKSARFAGMTTSRRDFSPTAFVG